MTRGRRSKKHTVYLRRLRSQTVRTVRYGRGGNAFCRSCYVAA